MSHDASSLRNRTPSPGVRSCMRRVLPAVLVAAVAAACSGDPRERAAGRPSPAASASPSPAPRPVHSPADLAYVGQWVLVSGTGPKGPVPILPDYRVTLVLRGRRASGSSTCNGYGGRFWITGTRFTHIPISFSASEAGCPTKRAGLAETRYFDALIRVDRVEAEQDRLHLTGIDVELVFERIPPVDMDAIVDRTWISGPHTLRLSSDGTFRATNGCRTYAGKWAERANRIFFPEVAARGCAQPAAPAPIDVGSGGFTVAVQGPRLTITFRGRAMVFESRP